MAKMLEDSFRAIGILEDDAPKYVTRSILEVVENSAAKRKKSANAQGPQVLAQTEDYVEITINSL